MKSRETVTDSADKRLDGASVADRNAHIYQTEERDECMLRSHSRPLGQIRYRLSLSSDKTHQGLTKTKMSKDNVEKYDGEKDMADQDVVAVLPPDNWVGQFSSETLDINLLCQGAR